MSDRYERLRQSYRPERVGVQTRVLMVGESRPARGKFFYLADSNLFYKTREAFLLAYGRRVEDGVDFLRQYQRSGFYLADLCDQPINRGMSDQECFDARCSGEPRLRRELNKLSPSAHVVIVIKRIEEHVRQAGSKRTDLMFHPALPFPNWPDQQIEYVRGLAKFLRKHGSLTAS